MNQNCDPMKQVFGLMGCFNIKNYCHKFPQQKDLLNVNTVNEKTI